MLSNPITWSILAPLVGGAIAAIFLLIQNLKRTPSRYVPWLRLVAFVAVVLGLVAEVVFLLEGDGSVTFYQLGITLSMTTPARMVLVAANVSLFCAAITAWTTEDEAYSPDHEWGLLLAALTSTLVAGAALASDRLVAAFCLLGAALAASALALARPRTALRKAEGDDKNLWARTLLARRITGGLKHLGLATLGTGLMVVGAVLVARYVFNLENRILLQLGLALLATGTIVLAGAMPFASAFADTLEAAPSAALLILGAGTPVALVVGLLMFAPVEGSLAGGAAATWLAALGVLLAGVRALGIETSGVKVQSQGRDEQLGSAYAILVAMTAAAATGWAIFGVLSGSRSGAVGAVLIAGNIALALPIMVISRRWAPIGAASLLGLPPFGGFAGTILVAGSAASAGGVWLAILLVGSALVAAGWLRFLSAGRSAPARSSEWQSGPDSRNMRARLREWVSDPVYLLPPLLAIVQIALFVASNQLIEQLNNWAQVPWLVGP